MVRYEVLLLARTEVTEDEIKILEEGLEAAAKKSQGSMISFDRWGKYRLAYPVDGSSYGVYMLARFELPKAVSFQALQSIDQFIKVKCDTFVMRHTNTKLHATASLVYNKPESLDMVRPSRSEGFLKDGKMESLLSSVDASSHGEDPSRRRSFHASAHSSADLEDDFSADA